MSYKDKKEMARALYLNSSLNWKEIATQSGVTEKTLRKWREEDDWETLKDLKTITRNHLLQDSYAQLKKVNIKIEALSDDDHKGMKMLYDAKAIIGKDIDRLSDHPLHMYIGVMDEFTNWIGSNEPAKLKEVSALTMEFIEDIHKRKK